MPREIHIPPLGWHPRPHQVKIWADMEAEIKNILVVTHRRFGKDELGLNDCGRRAAMKPANYFYMFPEQEHARRAMMKSINPSTGVRRIDEAFPPGFRIGDVKEQEMVVDVHSAGGKKSSVQFLGSDNYDAVRGASPYGIYLSEWAECDPQALVVLRPIVEENGGFFRFLTTTKGKNHVYKQLLAQQGKPDWACHYLTATETGVFSAAQLAEKRQEAIDLLGPDLGRGLFEQEYLCTFETVTPGSYYIDLLLKLEASGRMTGHAVEFAEGWIRPDCPVHKDPAQARIFGRIDHFRLTDRGQKSFCRRRINQRVLLTGVQVFCQRDLGLTMGFEGSRVGGEDIIDRMHRPLLC